VGAYVETIVLVGKDRISNDIRRTSERFRRSNRIRSSFSRLDNERVFIDVTCRSTFLASEQLAQWDRRIESFCVQVNQVLDKIQVVHPDWCLQTMTSIETRINAATHDNDVLVSEEINGTEIKSMDIS
jgi:hypothetical protein